MLGVVLQRWPVRRLALICPNCRRDASLANVSRGRTMLTGYLTCEGCLQIPDVAGWRLAAKPQARDGSRST
jgi:hypothetical protein